MNAGFIILRHVNDELTNRYWIHCYYCVRWFYPHAPILIIDDNSTESFLTEIPLENTTILKGEYPGRGELLPYYYFLTHKLFDVAVIIHDSVFLNARVDFCVNTYRSLWEFEHDWDQEEDETRLIQSLDNHGELLEFHQNKALWKGCFGCMTVIRHDFLVELNKKYNFSKLLDGVLTRYNRCSFERVIGCMLQKEGRTQSVFGDIHAYKICGLPFSHIKYFRHLPVIKCWTGRSFVVRTLRRNYHVPHDKNPTTLFTREKNLFGDVQDFLSLQEPIKRIVININNPNYVSRFCQEHPAMYSVDIHYKNSGIIKTLEGNNCEELVRQTITFIRLHDDQY